MLLTSATLAHASRMNTHSIVSTSEEPVGVVSADPVLAPTTASDPFDRPVFCIMGLPFDAIDSAAAVRRIQAAINQRTPCFLSTPNLNFVIASRENTALRDSVIHSDLSIADGMPIVWIARLLGLPIRERVAGSSLFQHLRAAASKPVNIYFFGGPVGVAATAANALNQAPDAFYCVGHECPGFGSVEDMSSARAIAQINDSHPDFLVVSLGAKKGQAWIERNLERLHVPVISHLGAVVNFLAGTVTRAPGWVQRCGLEWLWRIKEEPALFSRYAGDGRKFLTLLRGQVFPYAWFLMRRRFTDAPAPVMTGKITLRQECGTFFLGGECVLEKLGPLRELLKKHRAQAWPITLDLSDVSYIDSAFIGLLMLVRKQQDACGLKMTVLHPDATLRQIFDWNGAAYLLA